MTTRNLRHIQKALSELPHVAQLPIDQRIVTPSIVLRESTAPVAGVFAQYR